jgi:hypothetical protein
MAAARRAAGLARGALGRGRGGTAGTDPAGLAGGRVWVLARGALMPRRLVRVGLFAAASAGAAWVAYPQLGVGHVAEGRFSAIAPVLVLAVLPLLSRRFFGAASPGRIGGSLRVLCYAAILALLSAWTILMVFSSLLSVKPAYQRIFCNDRCTGVPGRSSGGPTWQAEILIMLLILGYAGVTLFLTSRRSQVTRSTLATGTVTTLGTGTTMLMLKSPWLLPWLNHGRHLTGFATYRYELYTTNHTGAYVLMLMFFPVIGLITSYLAAVIANPAPLDTRSPSPGLPMTSGG